MKCPVLLFIGFLNFLLLQCMKCPVLLFLCFLYFFFLLQCMKCPVLLFLRFLYFLLFFVPTSALNSARTACTCASLTPAARFQGSSSLCPSPFHCYILRDTFHTLLFFQSFLDQQS